MAGLNKPVMITENNFGLLSKKYNIPSDNSYYIDRLKYLKFIQNSSLPNKNINNHLQPLQTMYFDKKGNCITYFVNCNAPGFPNIKWNYKGALNNFPAGQQTVIDTSFNISALYNTFSNKPTEVYDYSQVDYTILMFWSDYLGRQTKRFLDAFNDNIKKGNQYKINIIYINTDNLFVNQNHSKI